MTAQSSPAPTLAPVPTAQRSPEAATAPATGVEPSVRASPTAQPTSAPPEPEITSVSNFRDVAGKGDGLALAGGRMARGVVYRSGRLKDLSAGDRRELADLGVSDIYDLRTTQVARRSPDPTIKGAGYHWINLFGVYSTSFRFDSVAEAQAQREQMNRDFVADPGQRRRTAKVLKGIAAAEGPVIIHCSEGKDRTGWIAAVLQLAAGADREQVMDEYLLSNEYRKDEIDDRYAAVRRSQGRRAADIDTMVYVVDDSYLQAGLDELDARYGDVDSYLTKGLKLSERTIATLRARLRA